MVLKHVAKIVLAFGEAVGKAFTRAVREEYIASKNAAQNQTSSSKSSNNSTAEAIKANIKLGISLQESIQILNVKTPLDRKEIEERYTHLFDVNDKSKGGTLYLQSKIYRAKERLDQELKRIDLQKENLTANNTKRD